MFDWTKELAKPSSDDIVLPDVNTLSTRPLFSQNVIKRQQRIVLDGHFNPVEDRPAVVHSPKILDMLYFKSSKRPENPRFNKERNSSSVERVFGLELTGKYNTVENAQRKHHEKHNSTSGDIIFNSKHSKDSQRFNLEPKLIKTDKYGRPYLFKKVLKKVSGKEN